LEVIFMGKKLYVGNLPYTATDARLAEHFAAAGTVESAKVIMDRDSGRSKGFGFVEMASDGDAQKAIEALNGQVMDGRPLNVSEARPQAPREDRGGGGGYGGGGGGGGGGGRGGRGGDRGGRGGRDRW
jgi:RNA recognition motif-containing protein